MYVVPFPFLLLFCFSAFCFLPFAFSLLSASFLLLLFAFEPFASCSNFKINRSIFFISCFLPFCLLPSTCFLLPFPPCFLLFAFSAFLPPCFVLARQSPTSRSLFEMGLHRRPKESNNVCKWHRDVVSESPKSCPVRVKSALKETA